MDLQYIIKLTSSVIAMYWMVCMRTLEAANLNEPCGSCSADNALCKNNLRGCGKGTCACKDGYRMTSENTCKMIRGHYEYCTETTQVCRDIHMACKVNTCVCTTGYKYDNYIGRCIPVATTHLGDSCVTVNDCYQDTSDPNSVECAADFGTTEPRVCRCRLGYIRPKDGFLCRKPYVAEACISSENHADDIGCAPSNKSPIDGSQITEECWNGVCRCPMSSIQQRINVMGHAYNVCLAKFFNTLLEDGQNCTLSYQCRNKLCYGCPGESSKYCVTYGSRATIRALHSGLFLLLAVHLLSS